mmetsp:Transcript_29698/g.78269  ORF Transcript_29698/g.78269 Transcript_29698/m.78269 type:complete len:223 (+) Transcript_29698:207-875(+)
MRQTNTGNEIQTSSKSVSHPKRASSRPSDSDMFFSTGWFQNTIQEDPQNQKKFVAWTARILARTAMEYQKAYYDCEPVSFDCILKEIRAAESESKRCREEVTEKMDAKENRGPYKQWFFKSFARSRISMNRHTCASDLKRIFETLESDVNSRGQGSHEPSRNPKSEPACPKRTRDRRITSAPSNQFTNSDSEDDESEAMSETWVECDQCCKWRRLPKVPSKQ